MLLLLSVIYIQSSATHKILQTVTAHFVCKRQISLMDMLNVILVVLINIATCLLMIGSFKPWHARGGGEKWVAMVKVEVRLFVHIR